MTSDVFAARPCGMEALDVPQHRTQVNPSAGWPGPGECALQHDARYPTGTRSVVGAVAARHRSFLPREISTGPRGGSVHEGNDVCAKPVEKSDHPVVAVKPGNAGGAKGVTG